MTESISHNNNKLNAVYNGFNVIYIMTRIGVHCVMILSDGSFLIERSSNKWSTHNYKIERLGSIIRHYKALRTELKAIEAN